MSPRDSCRRVVLNHATYSTIASSSWLRVRQTRSAISSVLKVSTKLSAMALRLLCQERDGSGVVEVGDQERVEAAGQVAHEAAADLAASLAFCGAAGDVGLGFGVVLHADHRDRVERIVGLAIAAAVEAMADCLAAGGLDGRGAAECRQGALAPQSVRVVAGEREQLGGGLAPDAVLGEQPWSGECDEFVELGLERADLGVQRAVSTRDRAQNAARDGLGVATAAGSRDREALDQGPGLERCELGAQRVRGADDDRADLDR